MEGESDSFNLNIEVGWIAPHGINNGEDHGELVHLALKIIHQGLTAQPTRVLNEKIAVPQSHLHNSSLLRAWNLLDSSWLQACPVKQLKTRPCAFTLQGKSKHTGFLAQLPYLGPYGNRPGSSFHALGPSQETQS